MRVRCGLRARPCARLYAEARRGNGTFSGGMAFLCSKSMEVRGRAVAGLLALALLAARLGACSSLGLDSLNPWAKKDLPADEPAEKLYNEGVYLLNEKRDYKEANKRFEEVDRQHPYSDWARKSLLMSAYSS